MGNFLTNNQKQEVRVQISEDIILYEPNDEQFEELKNILNSIDIKKEDNKEVEISLGYIRYIIRNLCKDGNFVDELSDDELINLWENGNINIVKLKSAIEDLLSEIAELIAIEQSSIIKMYTQMVNILNSNQEMDIMKGKFDKLFKKQGYDIKFEDILNGNITLDNIGNKKTKKNKK